MKFYYSKYVWFDGKFLLLENAKVPVTTHAIHYGTSIFEGIRAYWNSKNLYVFRLKEHIKRFRNSGNFYNISLNFSDKQIENAIINLCKKNKIRKSCYIRAFYFVGQYGINLHVTKKAPTHVAIFTFPFDDLFDKNGITATISKWRKFSNLSTPVQAKMGGNYLNSILATQDAKQKGFDEAILLDQSGNVSEAPSGTAAEITPIIKIDKKKIGNGKVGKITKSLMTTYTNIVMNKNENYSNWLTSVLK